MTARKIDRWFRLHTVAAAIIIIFVDATAGVKAQDRIVPAPRVTIYPGDVIHESMLEELSVRQEDAPEGAVVDSKAMLLGRVAKRTLLPGKPIPPIAVDSPRLVSIGSQVKIVFDEAGLTIIAYGAALQAGAVGDLIRVRNQDSGLIVSGRIQPDGSIRVGEG